MIRKYSLLLFLCLGLVGSTAAQKGLKGSMGSSDNGKWTEARLQKLYTNFLDGEGISYEVDSDGDVQFTYNDFTYFIEVNEDDPEFFRVVLFNIWPIESAEEAVQVDRACSVVNHKYKCVKIYPTTNDNVWLAVELFLESPDDFKGIFKRCLKVIDDGTEGFVEAMKAN